MPDPEALAGPAPTREQRPEPNPRGIALSSYRERLRKVRAAQNDKPIESLKRLLSVVDVAGYCDITGNNPADDLAELVGGMPLEHLRRLSFDALCKIRHSKNTMMRNDVERLFDESQNHFLVAKIQNSIWRWGNERARWNDVVAAYDGIRAFDFGLPGFEVTFDHTRGHNRYGYSEYSRTYLDGALAFLVHHKDEHVLTIGFSVSGKRSILLQQVQLKRPRGNRWLYRLPGSMVAHAIDRLRAAFPGHRLLIADAGDVARHNVDGMKQGLASIEREFERACDRQGGIHDDEAHLAIRREDYARLKKHHDALAADVPRLEAIYRDVAPHRLGAETWCGQIRHYRVHVRRPNRKRPAAEGAGTHD